MRRRGLLDASVANPEFPRRKAWDNPRNGAISLALTAKPLLQGRHEQPMRSKPMRVLLAATMAASVLAIGLRIEPAVSLPLPLGGSAANPDAPVHKVQQEKDKGPMSPGPGKGTPGMGSPGQGGPGMGSQGGPGMGTQGQGGPAMRQGDRGKRGEGERMGDRSRAQIGGDRGQRHSGRRLQSGRGYGYVANCGWLRQRALATGSPFWWRQYRECRR
jgi:hypothetical protein